MEDTTHATQPANAKLQVGWVANGKLYDGSYLFKVLKANFDLYDGNEYWHGVVSWGKKLNRLREFYCNKT